MKKRILVVSALSIAGLAGTVGLTGLAGAAPTTHRAVNFTNTSYKTVSGDSIKESTKAEAPEAKTAEADGPGGHQDSNGVNVNHQFQGQE